MKLICQQDPFVRYPGESWLYSREDGFRAVVDVGEHPDFGLKAAAYQPDVLVLTHDDKDHVGAVHQFLDSVSKPSERRWGSDAVDPLEIWMPYDWVRLLLAVEFAQSAETEQGTAGKTSKVARAGTGPNTARRRTLAKRRDEVSLNSEIFGTETVGASVRLDDEGVEYPRHSGRNAKPDPQVTAGDLERLVEAAAGLKSGDVRSRVAAAAEEHRKALEGWGTPLRWTKRGTPKSLGERAGETWARTTGIIQAALKIGATVRFFDPDTATAVMARHSNAAAPWRTQGLEGKVTIINAWDVPLAALRPRDATLSLVRAAYLTVQNRRALATYLWPTPGAPGGGLGAIIWSDTEHRVAGQKPSGGIVPWRWTGVMSAPHHASTDADHVDLWRYKPPHVKVLLSHNKHANTTHFLAVPASQRSCTICATTQPITAIGWTGQVWKRACMFEDTLVAFEFDALISTCRPDYGPDLSALMPK